MAKKESESSGTKALDLAVSGINKQFGEGTLMRLGDANKMQIDVIPTGNIAVDLALGVGGLPRGRICEIYGPESSGKTTLCLSVIAEAQRQGGTAVFVDVEHALDPRYAKVVGVDLENLMVSQPESGEDALNITETLIRSGAVDVVVVDVEGGGAFSRFAVVVEVVDVISVYVITLLFNSIQVSAQSAVIYEGRYGYDAIAHIDDDVIYKGRYGYDAILHIDDNVIYKGRYSYDAVAHFDDGVLYKGRYGYDAIFHIDDNVIYKGRYGYDAVAHFDDGVLYKGRYGYDAILHVDGYLTKTQLFAILLIDLVY